MLTLLAATLLLALHPDSLSATDITVDGAEVWLEMRTQVMSLREVLPSLDADGDGSVDEAELTSHRDAVAAYIGDHYRLVTGSDRAGEGGTALTPEFMGLLFHEPGIEQAAGYREGAVDVALRFTHDEPIRDLSVRCDLFLETSPLHIDALTLTWKGGESYRFGLDARSPEVRVDPEGRGAAPDFARRSVRHQARAWESWSFLLALVLSARDRRALALLGATALTAHGAGQALTASAVVVTGPWAGFVEAAGALAMAYLAADVLLQPEARRPRWPEALAFGGALGLSAGAALRGPLRQELHRGLAAAGWISASIGVQVVWLAAAALLASRLSRSADDPLVPARIRRPAAWALTAAGLAGFVLRL